MMSVLKERKSRGVFYARPPSSSNSTDMTESDQDTDDSINEDSVTEIVNRNVFYASDILSPTLSPSYSYSSDSDWSVTDSRESSRSRLPTPHPPPPTMMKRPIPKKRPPVSKTPQLRAVRTIRRRSPTPPKRKTVCKKEPGLKRHQVKTLTSPGGLQSKDTLNRVPDYLELDKKKSPGQLKLPPIEGQAARNAYEKQTLRHSNTSSKSRTSVTPSSSYSHDNDTSLKHGGKSETESCEYSSVSSLAYSSSFASLDSNFDSWSLSVTPQRTRAESYSPKVGVRFRVPPTPVPIVYMNCGIPEVKYPRIIAPPPPPGQPSTRKSRDRKQRKGDQVKIETVPRNDARNKMPTLSAVEGRGPTGDRLSQFKKMKKQLYSLI